jgi:hypothetical protein
MRSCAGILAALYPPAHVRPAPSTHIVFNDFTITTFLLFSRVLKTYVPAGSACPEISTGARASEFDKKTIMTFSGKAPLSVRVDFYKS